MEQGVGAEAGATAAGTNAPGTNAPGTNADRPGAARHGGPATWRLVVDGIVLLLMLGLAFFGIAVSDIEATFSWPFWTGAAVAYGVLAFVLAWLHSPGEFSHRERLLQLFGHWLAVVGTVHAVRYFVLTDHMTDGQAGLTMGLAFALATFLCGIYIQWRMMLVGLALGLATITVAVIEENIWVLVGIGFLVLLTVYSVQHLWHRLARGREAG